MAGRRSKYTGALASGALCQLAKLSLCFYRRWVEVCNKFLCYRDFIDKTNLNHGGQENDLSPIQDCNMIFSLPVKTRLIQCLISHPRDRFSIMVCEQLKLTWQGQQPVTFLGEERSGASTSFKNLLAGWVHSVCMCKLCDSSGRYLFWAYLVEMVELKPAVNGKEATLCIELADCRRNNY